MITLMDMTLPQMVTSKKKEGTGVGLFLAKKLAKQIGGDLKLLNGSSTNDFDKINTLKKTAPGKINKIAIETSSELVKKLIGAEVNNSSISAIVDDLSKRNGDKYYGN